MMKLQKISLIFFLTIVLFSVCGCTKVEEESGSDVTGTTTVEQSIVSRDFDVNGTGTLSCTQEAVAGENIDVELSYNINYKRGNILELVSVQKVISSLQENLDLYEDAYSDISKNYVGLNYYDAKIVRDSDSVTYTIVINYDKIDIDELLDIEGEEDNIIKNGKAKLSLWLDLAGKMGVVCEEV